MRIFKHLLFVIAVAGFGARAGKPDKKKIEAVPGEYVVKFRKNRAQTSDFKLARLGFSMSKPINTREALYLVKALKSVEAKKAIASLKSMGDIQYAEPNYIYRALEDLPQKNPAVAQFGGLWGMHNTGQAYKDPDEPDDNQPGKVGADIKALEAWALHTGTGKVIVGVIDTGVDYTHPNLRANIWSSPDNPAVHGYNAITGALDPMDDNEHGTHVSGTIGADPEGDNGHGVVGVNWNVKIMGCKFLSDDGSGSLANAVKAIDWCVDHGAQILNNSWGGGPFSQALMDSIQRASDKGVLFIAAAGNDANDNDGNPYYPAAYKVPNMISVAASDNTDHLAFFSNYGATTVHLAAPGHQILSTVPGGKYAIFSGSSMAAPHVAGAAALLWSQDPSLLAADIKGRLLSSTDKLLAFRQKTLTAGRLNLYNLLAGVNPAPLPEIPADSWTPVAEAISTPHPYASNSDLKWTIEEPGATFIRLHFTQFATESIYDTLEIIDANTGQVLSTLSGTKTGDFWTNDWASSKIELQFMSDTSMDDYGFDIDTVQWTKFSFTQVLTSLE